MSISSIKPWPLPADVTAKILNLEHFSYVELLDLRTICKAYDKIISILLINRFNRSFDLKSEVKGTALTLKLVISQIQQIRVNELSTNLHSIAQSENVPNSIFMLVKKIENTPLDKLLKKLKQFFLLRDEVAFFNLKERSCMPPTKKLSIYKAQVDIRKKRFIKKAKAGEFSNINLAQIDHLYLTSLSSQIRRLPNLTSLSVLHNPLYRLPEEVCLLSNLTELFLSGNRLSVLPREIPKLSKLATLNLTLNRFSDFPKGLCELPKLSHLVLNNNCLSKLPKEFQKLTQLKHLHISHNLLTAVPEEICRFTNLETLDLCKNKITTLPSKTGDLCSLKTLNVSWNKPLTSLPIAELEKLTGLEHLTIDSHLENDAIRRRLACKVHFMLPYA